MAFRLICGEGEKLPKIRGFREGVSQAVWVEPQVIAHIRKNRQVLKSDLEAGGQLFGSVQADRLIISSVTGPYPKDQRTRYSYRSDPKSAQKAIDKHAKRRLLYLGEWHTHAQKIPEFSSHDLNAIKRICGNSSLNIDALILLIAGNGVDFNWLRIWTFEDGRLIPWETSVLANQIPVAK